MKIKREAATAPADLVKITKALKKETE